MAHEIIHCRHCGHEIEFERYNARFGDQGFMYCDSDPTVVTWSSYDRTYSRLSGDTHPWMLDDQQKILIEDAILPCPNGGHFRFDANPRCPRCNAELSELRDDPAYFVIMGSRVDGDRVPVWRPRG
jgi:hypothetical protein